MVKKVTSDTKEGKWRMSVRPASETYNIIRIDQKWLMDREPASIARSRITGNPSSFRYTVVLTEIANNAGNNII